MSFISGKVSQHRHNTKKHFPHTEQIQKSFIHNPQKGYHEKNILIFYPESLWCVRNWWRLSSTLCLFNIVTPSSLSGFQGETTFEQSRSLTKGIFCRRFLLFLDFLRFLSLLQNFWQNSVTHVPLWVDYMTKYIEVSELAYQHHQHEQSKKISELSCQIKPCEWGLELTIRKLFVRKPSDYAHLYFRI